MIRPRGVMAMVRRNACVLRRMLWSSLLGHVGEPLFYIVVFGYGLGRFVGSIEGMPYLDWLIPGIAIISAVMSGAMECTYGAFTRMERQQTYLAIASTPVSIEEVVVGEAAWGGFMGMTNAVLTVIVGMVFGAHLSPERMAAVPVIAFFAAFLGSSIALLFMSFARGYEHFAIFFTVILTPSLVLSGAYFPIAVFPEPLQWVGPLHPAGDRGPGRLGRIHRLSPDDRPVRGFVSLVGGAADPKARDRLRSAGTIGWLGANVRIYFARFNVEVRR